MKKALVFGLFAILAITGCQAELEEVNPEITALEESKVFTATIDDDFSGDTKTSLDGSGNVLWKLGDQVSIFAGSTVNEQYQVSDDSDGKTKASLNKVSSAGSASGTSIGNNVALYPYASTAELIKSGSSYVIRGIELPATQTYAKGSFGNGAFPMVAVSGSKEDMNLKFKNVLGGLKLQLKGTATITSITVKGNNDEDLYGDALIVSNGSTPSISLSAASAKTVTLDCGAGVTLDSETATPFIIAIPPMTMTGGFTVVVTDTAGKQMEITTTKSQTITRSNLLKMPLVTYEGKQPLTFTSTGSTSISLIKKGEPDAITLEYKVDDGAWTSYTVGNAIDLTDGQKVSFRAGEGGNSSLSKSHEDYYKFTVSGSGTISASGNIMSLLNQEGGLTIPSAYCFRCLFVNCRKLTTSPELPATTLADYCYGSMFYGCTGLTTAPELPATTLADYCYLWMFEGCTGLTTAPELPATTLADWCYHSMFSGCTSLITAPELPATTLAEYCYYGMFSLCSSLTTAPDLPATTLAERCYDGMFWGCTGLTAAPELPATTLAEYCYEGMFEGCTGLTSTPKLPATTLPPYCYEQMFSGCIGLTSAPELPATTLAEYCYEGMFRGCTGLTTAPDLPATTLADYCYYYMFDGCTSLTTAPELPATTLAEDCYVCMFYGCTSLTTAHELPATTLAIRCYQYMFYGCTGLTTAPELPATTLAKGCYYRMFMGCTGLTTAPELPATTLAEDCYGSMFYGCTGLTAAPELPATTLAEYCYVCMFNGCTSLTTAPELPATTLAFSCYSSMFSGCTSLTTAPELPATTLAYLCYNSMFEGCTNLNYIKALFTTTPSSSYTGDWVSGVAATGTFVKSKDATWDVRGVNGIPEGWTVYH